MKAIGDVMRRTGTPQKSVDRPSSGKKTGRIDDKTIFFLAERTVSALYGARGRENIIPRYFQDGKLHFSCHSPLWANELWVTRDAFRNRLNRDIGKDLVREIKISE